MRSSFRSTGSTCTSAADCLDSRARKVPLVFPSGIFTHVSSVGAQVLILAGRSSAGTKTGSRMYVGSLRERGIMVTG